MEYLLALDQATINTGYALFRNGELLIHGVVPVGSSFNYLERITLLRAWVKDMIETYEPYVTVAIEDIQLQEQNGSKEVGYQTFKKLAHLQGVLLQLLTELKIKYEIVVPSSWKHSCGIKGSKRAVQKANAAQFVKDTYNISPTQDECDAICIGTHILLKNAEINWD